MVFRVAPEDKLLTLLGKFKGRCDETCLKEEGVKFPQGKYKFEGVAFDGWPPISLHTFSRRETMLRFLSSPRILVVILLVVGRLMV